MKEGDIAIQKRGPLHLRNLLMVSQIAGSLTLLAILGMLALGIQSTMGIQTGFNPANISLISLDPVRDGYTARQTDLFFRRLMDRVSQNRSITTACLTETVPVSMGGESVMVSTPHGGSNLTMKVVRHVVGKQYFETTGIAILAGHGFRDEDEANPTTSVVISRELASRLWPGEYGLGRRIEIRNGEIVPAKILPGTYDYRAGVNGSGRTELEVTGVVNDVAEGLVVQKPRPALYLPLRRADYGQPAAEGITLLLRSAPGSDAMRAAIREIAVIDPKITPFNLRTMPDQIDQFMTPLQIASWTYAVIGIFGLVLASVGLAGMTAYSVARRGREIGIRMALGAQSKDVVRLVMSEGLILITAGIGLGLAGAWAGGRLLASMNSSVGTVTSTSTSNPVVMIGAPFLLGTLALLACYVPARNSVRVDHVVGLRQE
jgi:putative ABC transport system permease protein